MLVKAGAFLADQPDITPDVLRNRLAESEMVALIAYLQKLGAYQEVNAPAGNEGRPLDPDSYRRKANPESKD